MVHPGVEAGDGETLLSLHLSLAFTPPDIC